MTKDFDGKVDKPSWPLSSYGPAKNEKNLLPPLDESPEELRLKAVTAMRNGTINKYLQYEQNAFANAEQVFVNARNDPKGAFEAAKRNSLGTESLNNTPAFPASGTDSVFGAANAPASSFGQPSAFGAQNTGPTSAFGQQQGASTFGKPAFGAPAFSQAPSTFGQPSIANPAFGGGASNGGAFSAFARPGPSAFATAATNPTASSGSVFGQSAFGSSGGRAQPGQSAFDAANSPSTNSAFGGPSAFGQTSTSGSGFGQASNNPASAFGQPSTSTFGQASTAPSTSSNTALFGQPTQSTSTSTFGQPTSVFGQAAPATSAFSQTTPTSAFGQSTSAFGAQGPAQQSAFGQTTSSVSQSGPTGVPKPHAKSFAPDFSNAKSTYKPGSDPYDTLLPANYSSLLPEDVRAAFAAPRFSWDNVPDWIPPMDMR
ncbi:hypothetical protein BC827DRAFT_1179627 [Russula dissimulans]|nr:hypothetical protein BC827DRAFT_1179627 [Russula dissimulans]